MGQHDKHLPRRHMNKTADYTGAPPARVRELVRAQGSQAKEDAKNAKPLYRARRKA